MGKMQRDKGVRREREFASLVGGQRVPLSGAAGGTFAQDVLLPNGWRAQVKARDAGWRMLYRDLGDADLLAVRADRAPWLVVMPVDRFLALLQSGRPGSGAGGDDHFVTVLK